MLLLHHFERYYSYQIIYEIIIILSQYLCKTSLSTNKKIMLYCKLLQKQVKVSRKNRYQRMMRYERKKIKCYISYNIMITIFT